MGCNFMEFREGQGQFTGFHFLISRLKTFAVSNCFNSLGTISQILRPRKEMLSVPFQKDFESRSHY